MWPYDRKRSLRFGLLASVSVVIFASALFAYREWNRFREAAYQRNCREARSAKNWGELQRLGEQWTAWDWKNADGWLFRADAAQHLGDFELAATCLSAIPNSAPKLLPALVSLSALQFGSLNRPLEGVATCERILKIDSRTSAAHQQLIEFYAMSLQRRQLEFHIRFAIQCSREPPSAYVYLFLIDTMRLANAVELNASWLSQYPDSETFLAAHVLQMPEPEGGIRGQTGNDKYTLVDQLLTRFPKNLELLAYKLDLGIRNGNVDEVISHLQNLPAVADEDCRFWRAKGWIHLNRGEIPKAKTALQIAMKLFPMDWSALNWMADSLRREGDLLEAERLELTVQMARLLRKRMTTGGPSENVSTEILEELAKFAELCGDTQVASALQRRLHQK